MWRKLLEEPEETFSILLSYLSVPFLEEDLLPGQLSAAGGNLLHSALLPVGPGHWHSLPHLTGDKVRIPKQNVAI
jgi:hypothetical protein